jgi:hypothetical protein
MHTLIAVEPQLAATVIIRMPGTRKSTYDPPRAASPSPRPIGPPRMYTNSSSSTTGEMIDPMSSIGKRMVCLSSRPIIVRES